MKASNDHTLDPKRARFYAYTRAFRWHNPQDVKGETEAERVARVQQSAFEYLDGARRYAGFVPRGTP